MTEESRSVFAEMFGLGVGRVKKGYASGTPWTQQSFNAALMKLTIYEHRPNTTKGKEADRNSFKRWRGGEPPGLFYSAVMREIFLGNPPACDVVGKGKGHPNNNCACEPCHWKRRLDSWLTASKKGQKTNVPREQAVPPAGPTSLPASAETAEAVWSGDRALEASRKFVELHVHDTTGNTPYLTVSLSYGYERFTLEECNELQELRVKIQPTSLVIRPTMVKAQKVHRTVLNNDRVCHSNGCWVVNASPSLNDMTPLVEQALVQLEQTLPGAVVDLTVTCSQDDFKVEIQNPPEGASATDLRVLERVFQKWQLGMDKEELVMVRGALRRTS
jgi:hypothetical protein